MCISSRRRGTKARSSSSLRPTFQQVAKYSDWWIPVKARHRYGDLDGGQPRHLQGILCGSPGPVLRQLPQRVHRHAVPDRVGAGRRQLQGGPLHPRQHGEALQRRGERRMEVPCLRQGERAAHAQGRGGRPLEPGKGQVEYQDGRRAGRYAHRADAFVSWSSQDETVQVAFYEFAEQRWPGAASPRYVETERRPRNWSPPCSIWWRSSAWAADCRATIRRVTTRSARTRPPGRNQYTNIGRDTVARLAREFASNAEATRGKSMIIVGASINHWYNNNLMYRAPIYRADAVRLLRSQRRRDEPLRRPGKTDAGRAVDESHGVRARLAEAAASQQSPPGITSTATSGATKATSPSTRRSRLRTKWAKGHAMDLAAMAVRMGWMPYFPQFNDNNFEWSRSRSRRREAICG
jgi:nitrate reductase alpha subunit